jgi:hypothetical protein
MSQYEDFTPKRKYVSVVYDDASQLLLRNWALENGFDLTTSYSGNIRPIEDFKFHTTIVYSKNEKYLTNQTLTRSTTGVIITGVKMLGENYDIPVLSLSAAGAIKQAKLFYEEIGLVDYWPTFNPHISISYAKVLPDMSKIKLPTFTPKFDKIVIEDLED